jgi:hypothetical protein
VGQEDARGTARVAAEDKDMWGKANAGLSKIRVHTGMRRVVATGGKKGAA